MSDNFKMLPTPQLRSWHYQSLERDAGQPLRPCTALTPILCGMTSSPFSLRHVLPLFTGISQIYQQHLTHLKPLVNPVGAQSPGSIWCITLQAVKLEIRAPLWCFGSVSSRTNVAQHTNEGGVCCSGPGWCWASPLKNSWEDGFSFRDGPCGVLSKQPASQLREKNSNFQGCSCEIKSSK